MKQIQPTPGGVVAAAAAVSMLPKAISLLWSASVPTVDFVARNTFNGIAATTSWVGENIGLPLAENGASLLGSAYEQLPVLRQLVINGLSQETGISLIGGYNPTVGAVIGMFASAIAIGSIAGHIAANRQTHSFTLHKP